MVLHSYRRNNILDIICCDNISYIAPLAIVIAALLGSLSSVVAIPVSDEAISDSLISNFA